MSAPPTGSLFRWISRLAVILLCASGVYYIHLRLPDSQLILDVTEATPAFAGLSQRLVCSNKFCGMEQLTVVMNGILAAGCFLLALVLTRISSWLQRRNTIRATRAMG